MIGIVISHPQLQDTQSFISITGIEKLDQLLNQVKIKTLQCLNYLLKYLFEEVPNQTKQESPLTLKALTLCPHFISTLLSVSKRPDILTLAQEETFQDVIVETLETLVLATGEKEFFNLLQPAYRDLVVHVCFGLMRTSTQELDLMTADPDQFVSLSLDICDKQKSRVVKTHAGKLLEAICDSIDGAVSFVTLFACQSLNQALQSNQ